MNSVENIHSTQVRPKRLALLDEIRGITLISMMLYHFLWDLVYIAGIDIPWYHGRGAHIWQQSICWTFIFLSGFCWSLGHRHLKRGLTVYLAGGLVTIVTLLLLPEDRVVFGVLTLIGSSMLLMIPLDRAFIIVQKRTAIVFLTVLSGFLFLLTLPVASGRLGSFVGLWSGDSFLHSGTRLPEWLYCSWLSTYLGFPMKDFYSTDYFPLIPWFFLFITGYFVHKIYMHKTCASEQRTREGGSGASVLCQNHLPPLSFIGRHSLLIYMLHQPVLYGVTMAIVYIRAG
ncbi:MAG: DUF1624 domain-containing protein [Butyrivibrio sp.]|nr:DUF1624 domain-containing protein [Muribaculum sp.]MCM1551775.1 DUF1624 domain-containing protein [Butyrivibrio sp.]